LQPFWQQEVVQDEPVLFIRDPETGEARASLLFDAREIQSVRNSAGDTTYQQGVDFQISPGSRELIAPSGSRVVTKTPADLRRPAKTQRHQLLKHLCQPGVALADMTSIWEEFFKRKKDADLTGNGVNHPNDFGHRVYAQVISTLLVDESE
jgi:hypothetical protein